MICISSLHEACRNLFSSYPLAAKAVNRSGTVQSMVLMLEDGDNAGYFVLSSDSRRAEPSYSVWPWPDGDSAEIEGEGSAALPYAVVDAVTRGIPIPRDGSLFGWMHENVVAALVVVYAEYMPAYPEPGWAVMPLVGTPEAQWPKFTGRPLFGHWSWGQCRSGGLISLDDLITANPATVYWVDTKVSLGSDLCAVAHDISAPEGYTLRHGCYVYYEVLRLRKPEPSLDALLAEPGKTDLASRFHRSGYGDYQVKP